MKKKQFCKGAIFFYLTSPLFPLNLLSLKKTAIKENSNETSVF